LDAELQNPPSGRGENPSFHYPERSGGMRESAWGVRALLKRGGTSPLGSTDNASLGGGNTTDSHDQGNCEGETLAGKIARDQHGPRGYT